MRPVSFPSSVPGDSAGAIAWLLGAVRELALASQEDIAEVADAFTITNLTETRTLDCTGATLGDLCNVVGTLISDIHKRGTTRGS